jgi:hypothetical protein
MPSCVSASAATVSCCCAQHAPGGGAAFVASNLTPSDVLWSQPINVLLIGLVLFWCGYGLVSCRPKGAHVTRRSGRQPKGEICASGSVDLL